MTDILLLHVFRRVFKYEADDSSLWFPQQIGIVSDGQPQLIEFLGWVEFVSDGQTTFIIQLCKNVASFVALIPPRGRNCQRQTYLGHQEIQNNTGYLHFTELLFVENMFRYCVSQLHVDYCVFYYVISMTLRIGWSMTLRIEWLFALANNKSVKKISSVILNFLNTKMFHQVSTVETIKIATSNVCYASSLQIHSWRLVTSHSSDLKELSATGRPQSHFIPNLHTGNEFGNHVQCWVGLYNLLYVLCGSEFLPYCPQTPSEVWQQHPLCRSQFHSLNLCCGQYGFLYVRCCRKSTT